MNSGVCFELMKPALRCCDDAIQPCRYQSLPVSCRCQSLLSPCYLIFLPGPRLRLASKTYSERSANGERLSDRRNPRYDLTLSTNCSFIQSASARSGGQSGSE